MSPPSRPILFLAVLALARSATLYDALTAAVFLNNGTVHSSDAFGYQGIPCGYLEAENVTCAVCGWGVGGSCPYLYLTNSSTPTPCNISTPSPGMDRPGGDFMTIVQSVDSHDVCAASCCATASCVAWVYTPSAPGDYMTCTPRSHCCFLKSSVPNPVNDSLPGIITGVVQKAISGSTPPLGMRSAVPLGGVGAGALELRADGSVHEVTIMNASPAGAAKFGVLADMLAALRVEAGDGVASRAIRTSPPAYAQGVQAITYSGSYPVSRLTVQDASLPVNASLFAYSTLRPGDMIASALPAIAFTLTLSNPSPAAVNVSLFLSLPFGVMNDCARVGNVVTSYNASSAAACMHACDGNTTCGAWTWVASSGVCTLSSDVPHNVHQLGAACGVHGAWSSDGVALSRVQTPPGGAGGPANGDVTLRPLLDTSGASNANIAMGVSDDIAALYSAFASTGGMPPGNGVTSGVFTATSAAVGAATASATVAAGATATLSVVFAWYFPDRDHTGTPIGNFYSTLWSSSTDVAAQMAATLPAVVADINAHHAVFAGPGSMLPEWLQDAAINEMSHMRGMIWAANGTMREFEAPDCPDVDSVHNDYQRHLPYIWMMPEFEMDKLRGWTACASGGDGHVPEYMGSFGLGPWNQCGGRVMADTTTLVVVEIAEMYKSTGDNVFLAEMYPSVPAAVRWMVNNAGSFGLPQYLVSTYDIQDFQQYQADTFNSALYMTALRAAQYLATAMGDQATASLAAAAFSNASTAIVANLWNSTYSYFRAYTGGDAIMGDALYGAMVGLAHGFGWVLDTNKVASHLAMEMQYNGNAYGLRVVTGRHDPPPQRLAHLANGAASASRRVQQALPALAAHAAELGVDTQDDVNWMGAGPTWSYLQLKLGAMSVADALEPARLSTDNFRTRLNDWWNLVGITTSGDWGADYSNGMPYITSHYGFLLPNYYLVTAISGQLTDLPAGQLSFTPAYACPYTLPLVLAGVTGTIACTPGSGSNTYTVTIAFGALSLPAGGLTIAAVSCPYAVALTAGQSVTWSG